MYHRPMSSRTVLVLFVILGVVAALAMIVFSTVGLAQYTGEVCITFNGRTECRVASGATEEEAIRTGTDMACSALASGMTDRISCSRTEPTRVRWMDE